MRKEWCRSRRNPHGRHSNRGPGVTAAYVHADAGEAARAVATLSGEPHPLDRGAATGTEN